KVELAPREVEIYEFELIGMPDPDHGVFRVSCGKGMYVRSLARDLAVVLGTCGYVSALRRISSGAFGIENAVSLADLEGSAAKNEAKTTLLPIKSALEPVCTLNLMASEAQTLRSGQSLLIKPHFGDIFDEDVIFTEHNGVPVAMVEPVAGELRVLRGFHF
ncbi:MAG: tRNA pseudouridine(55) synthase TruB, partial [Alphaproteobacteria bacterium]|nr:tRNA pseudouridine(55) synthase TruB [Alphaproteobacteria bacterium]